MNNDFLLKSLDNENNNSIANLTSQKIKSIKNDSLQQLQLPRETLKMYHIKLKEYRYVDDLTDIKDGRYIRWINLTDPTKIYLTTGGIIIDIKICEGGIRNRKFQIKIDECLIFQKLSDQEKIILSALDHLCK